MPTIQLTRVQKVDEQGCRVNRPKAIIFRTPKENDDNEERGVGIHEDCCECKKPDCYHRSCGEFSWQESWEEDKWEHTYPYERSGEVDDWSLQDGRCYVKTTNGGGLYLEMPEQSPGPVTLAEKPSTGVHIKWRKESDEFNYVMIYLDGIGVVYQLYAIDDPGGKRYAFGGTICYLEEGEDFDEEMMIWVEILDVDTKRIRVCATTEKRMIYNEEIDATYIGVIGYGFAANSNSVTKDAPILSIETFCCTSNPIMPEEPSCGPGWVDDFYGEAFSPIDDEYITPVGIWQLDGEGAARSQSNNAAQFELNGPTVVAPDVLRIHPTQLLGTLMREQEDSAEVYFSYRWIRTPTSIDPGMFFSILRLDQTFRFNIGGYPKGGVLDQIVEEDITPGTFIHVRTSIRQNYLYEAGADVILGTLFYGGKRWHGAVQTTLGGGPTAYTIKGRCRNDGGVANQSFVKTSQFCFSPYPDADAVEVFPAAMNKRANCKDL